MIESIRMSEGRFPSARSKNPTEFIAILVGLDLATIKLNSELHMLQVISVWYAFI